jgi:hypothetical protein
MLIPFGIEQTKLKVYFIHINKVGFWLLSQKDRFFGEANALQECTAKLQQFELANSWLIIRMIDENYEFLKKEYCKKNPDNLNVLSLDAIEDDEMRLRLEIYVRKLLRDFQISHPVLAKYEDAIKRTMTDDNIFDYQSTVIYAALKFRTITDVDAIEKDAQDDELGYIDASKVSDGSVKVGISHLKREDLQNPMLSEQLLTKIYRYANTEHNNAEWQTTYMIEQWKVESESEKTNEPEELGKEQLKSSEELSEQAT